MIDNLGVLVVCFGGPLQQKIHTPRDMDLLVGGQVFKWKSNQI
jgi:hypothetical protein